MKIGQRCVMAGAGVLALLPGLIAVVMHMPAFGEHNLPYGDAINRRAVGERHVTNMVTAVNFDYRGLDTLGEEFILIAAVTGVIALLRGRRGENVSDAPACAPHRVIPPRSEAVVLVCRGFTSIVLLYGIYVTLHAQLTPGSGFQAGAIIASGALFLYLGEGYRTWLRLMRPPVFDLVEAAGALIFLGAGTAALFAGAKFLQNILPLGETRGLISGGLILVENAGVALAVTAGFILLLLEFLEETRAPKEDGEP